MDAKIARHFTEELHKLSITIDWSIVRAFGVDRRNKEMKTVYKGYFVIARKRHFQKSMFFLKYLYCSLVGSKSLVV